jgi:hypothetical protein
MKTIGTSNLSDEIVHIGKMTLGILVALIVCLQFVLNPGFIFGAMGMVLVIMTSVYLVYTAKPAAISAAALGAVAIVSGVYFAGWTGIVMLGLLLITCGMLMIFTQVWWASLAADMAIKPVVRASTPKKPESRRKAKKKK